MATTPILGWPVPDGTAGPATPGAFSALGGAAEKYVWMPFASSAARSAAIPAPVEGMHSFIAGVPEVYTSGAWRRADNPSMNAVGAALSGSPPALPAGRYLFTAGTFTGVCEAGTGALRVDFPTPFPNGLLTVVAWNGDGGAGGFVTKGTNATWGGGNKDYFHIQSYSATGALRGGQSVRVEYIAIGW